MHVHILKLQIIIALRLPMDPVHSQPDTTRVSDDNEKLSKLTLRLSEIDDDLERLLLFGHEISSLDAQLEQILK